MYIAKVLSNLGALEKIQHDYQAEYQEILNAIRIANIPDYSTINKRHTRDKFTSKASEIGKQIANNLEQFGWSKEGLFFGKEDDKGISNIDVAKSGIGLEVMTGKYAFVESNIFVKYPLFIRARKINIGIALVLIKSLSALGVGVVSYEMLSRRIKQVAPFIPRYPFAVIGLSDEKTEVVSEELTSELDLFLFENIGLTYADLKLQTEQHNCDFKGRLPDQPERIGKELCAFANNYKGGVLLVGVDDNGEKIGIGRNEIDTTQRRVLGIVQDGCDPSVNVTFKVFEFEKDPERCILAIHVSEIERKPCMYQNRIYIRNNATAVPANPEQVRRLLLGGLR